jgi:predicted lipoprotein with Yx(FWY)xxD motif
MRRTALLLLVGALVAAGCGGDDDDSNGSASPPAEAAGTTEQQEATTTEREEPAPEARKGTTITLADSEFGTMLFDSKKQAIYIFERDREDETVCYDDCAEAWPPVLTDGEPEAGKGVRESLLGTIERRDGELQVTYAGQPLYYYAHEGRGEVRCHNVNLNGGLWWVVGPDGNRRP